VRKLVLVSGAFAAACSFAPEYKRPEAGAPAEYRFAQPNESASIADLPWWQVFKDPVLQDLIRAALQNNQDLALAVARVDESRANVGIAKADFYPQISAQVDAAYGRPISREFNPSADTSGRYSGSLGLSWELDLWGRIRNSRDAALADLFATEDGRRAVVLALVSGLAQAYLELRSLDLELEIARSNTQTRQGTLDLFEARARRGIASDLEVNQARSDLAFTRAAIPETELQIAFKEHQICVLVGRAPGTISRGAALVDTPAPPQIPLGVPAQLLERRPDVLAAEQGVIGAGKRVGVAVADRLPTLSLSGFIGLQAVSLSNLFGSNAVAGSVGGGIFAPIFQGGRLASAEEASRARLDQGRVGPETLGHAILRHRPSRGHRAGRDPASIARITSEPLLDQPTPPDRAGHQGQVHAVNGVGAELARANDPDGAARGGGSPRQSGEDAGSQLAGNHRGRWHALRGARFHC